MERFGSRHVGPPRAQLRVMHQRQCHRESDIDLRELLATDLRSRYFISNIVTVKLVPIGTKSEP